ncbi:hypothetical protein [Pedobacter frigidisoli]|nr:hypothetical protein [Pedobacter frigidisoli]
MKTQNTPQLSKKTAFVFKNIKSQSAYMSPTTDMSQTIATSFIVAI